MARAGKYDHVTPSLPRLSGVEPERKEIVEAVKTEILTSDTADVYPTSLIDMNLDEAEDSIKNTIDLLKTMTYGRRHAVEFARAFAATQRVKFKLDELKGNIQLLLDAYEELMTEQFIVEGTKSIRLDTGPSVSVHDKPVAKMAGATPFEKLESREKFRLWCIKHGLERDMHLHESKMQALSKEMLLAGEAQPDGLEVYAMPEVRVLNNRG